MNDLPVLPSCSKTLFDNTILFEVPEILQPLKIIDSGSNLIQASQSDSQEKFVYIFSENASLSEVLFLISYPCMHLGLTAYHRLLLYLKIYSFCTTALNVEGPAC